MKVFTLVVLTSGDRHQKDVAVIDFDPKDLEGNPLNEIPHKMMYICPKYLNDKTPAPYREWMLAIQDSLDELVEENDYTVPEVRQIFDYIEKDLISPEERARMFDEYGEEQVKQQHFVKGVAKGIEKEKLEIAQKMLQQGMAISLISQITKLSEEAITHLKNENSIA
ncbi:conserved hypothetical protein [Beggiatoa sp. SS]|nr:conserved hypothetical protein [Beggiatoa sp. SS]